MRTLIICILVMMSSICACGKDNGKAINFSDFEKMIQTTPDIVLIDVRMPEEYSEGHIPGAININVMEEGFVSNVEKSVPKDKPLALYCKSGKRSAQATQDLLEKGGYCITQLEGGIMAWEGAELPVTNGKTDIYFTSDGKKIEIEPLIHASLRINFDGKEIEIDPVGKMGDRTTDYASFPKADLILVTHEHYDHLDPEAIKELTGKDTIVVTNPNSANILGYGEVMKNGDTKTIDGIEIEAVPAYNTSEDKLQFHPKGRDNGYVLNLDGIKVYIAGDTEVIPEMNDLKDIDIAFLPCNLPYTMTPEQLIEAAEIIKPKVVYPYHYGTTDLSPLTPALAPEGIYVRICPFDPGH